jgi:hypothetical protein
MKRGFRPVREEVYTANVPSSLISRLQGP